MADIETDLTTIRDEDSVARFVGNPLDDVDLSSRAIDALLLKTVGQTILEAIPVVGKLSNFLSSYNAKLDQARLYILLQEFENKHEDSDKFKEAFKKLIITPAGINLLNKVVRIVNVNTVDSRYVQLLAETLKKISDSDFQQLFEEHNYALSQIEKLTPQALILLSDFPLWPMITFASTTTSGITSGTGWDTAFANIYSEKKGASDEKTKLRIVHALNELRNGNMTNLEATHVPLSPVGKEVYRYITK